MELNAAMTKNRLYAFASNNLKRQGSALLLLAVVFFFGTGPSTEAAIPSNTRWSRTVKGHSCSPPQAAYGLLYVGTDQGVLHAFDQHTGKLKWRFQTGSKVPCSPLIGQDGNVYLSSYDGALYVLSAFNGNFVWKSLPDFVKKPTAASRPDYYKTNSPALSGKTVIHSTPDGEIKAHDRTNGQTIWSFAAMDNKLTAPVIYKDTVFIGCEDGRLIALNLLDGEQKWSFFAEDSIDYPPAVKNGRVYFGARDKKLYALKISTGNLLWTY